MPAPIKAPIASMIKISSTEHARDFGILSSATKAAIGLPREQRTARRRWYGDSQRPGHGILIPGMARSSFLKNSMPVSAART